MSATTSPRPSLSVRSPSIRSSAEHSSIKTTNTTSISIDAQLQTQLSPSTSRRAAQGNFPSARSQSAEQRGQNQTQTQTQTQTQNQTYNGQDDGSDEPPSELDTDGFDAAAWVRRILERKGLEEILKTEAGLIGGMIHHNFTEWAIHFLSFYPCCPSIIPTTYDNQIMIFTLKSTEIRSLDGERKALVYDNYSKLIAATDTIRKVRHSGLIQFPDFTFKLGMYDFFFSSRIA